MFDEDAMLRQAEMYSTNNDSTVDELLMNEVVAMRRERHRSAGRCRRCTWAWYPVGEYPWRCVRCPAVAVAL